MTVKVLKAEPGQHFPDLDLVTKLLQPKSSLQQALGDDRKYDATHTLMLLYVPGD